MKSNDIIFRILAFIIAMVAFGFYIFVIVNFTEGNIYSFPYLIFTAYFIICTIVFPFVALEDNDLVEKLKFLPGSTLVLVRFVAAPIVLFSYLSKNHND